jgi:hypothetical protein
LKDNISLGIYQHYKTGKLYEVIGIALHSETHEEMVIYKALYHCEKFGPNQVWVRPKTIFFELIFQDGQTLPRFKWVSKSK